MKSNFPLINKQQHEKATFLALLLSFDLFTPMLMDLSPSLEMTKSEPFDFMQNSSTYSKCKLIFYQTMNGQQNFHHYLLVSKKNPQIVLLKT